MRIAILGAGGAYKTEACVRRAARELGLAAAVLDVPALARRGRDAGAAAAERLARFVPDLLLLTRHAARLGDDALAGLARGRRTVFWYFDQRPGPGELRLARLADRTYASMPMVAERLAADGARARWLPQGMDPWLDRPAAWTWPWLRCDVSFVGSGPYPHRYPTLAAVAAAARLQVRGPDWRTAPSAIPIAGGRVKGRAFARVVRGARISLGIQAYPEMEHERLSASNRMWKVLGCGGFFLGPRAPEIDRLARGGAHCDWFASPDECVERVRHWLARPDERRRVAAAGRAHALAAHTYAHRLRVLLADGEFTP